jgi:hypothetical protein
MLKMAKALFTDEDDELLAELGVEVEAKSKNSRTPREERIIAGFEEIEKFVETNGRLPQHGEDKDIFERIYAVRLDKIRSTQECTDLLAGFDNNGLLSNSPNIIETTIDELDDDELLAELGVSHQVESDITKLTHVKSSAEKRAAEEIGRRSLCNDFENFKQLFEQIKSEIKIGVRKTLRFKEDASINKGEYFILGGQIAYIAEVGELTQDSYSKWDARLRIIFDNGTESNILLRSLQKALYKDESGRRVTDPNAGPLFDDIVDDADIESGTIYVLRSKSEHPDIKPHANLLHKIGVTGGNVATRITNAKLDPTFLMADVEIVATYELYNINRVKLENLLHRFFDSARLNIQIRDRFGNPTCPREWFLVPLFIIDEVVDKIKEGSLSKYQYDANLVKLINF